MLNRALQLVVVVMWTVCGIYLGLAGYFAAKLFENTSTVRVSAGTAYLTYGELSFKTRQDLQDFILDETASRWFTWLPDVPAELMQLLASSAWGILGAAIRLTYLEIENPRTVPPSWGNVLLTPVLGAGVAIGVYLLAFLLPAVLTVGPNTMRAETLVGLSFLSGIGCIRVYQWVQEIINRMAT
jgi:hypothetical protein